MIIIVPHSRGDPFWAQVGLEWLVVLVIVVNHRWEGLRGSFSSAFWFNWLWCHFVDGGVVGHGLWLWGHFVGFGFWFLRPLCILCLSLLFQVVHTFVVTVVPADFQFLIS